MSYIFRELEIKSYGSSEGRKFHFAWLNEPAKIMALILLQVYTPGKELEPALLGQNGPLHRTPLLD